MADAKQLKITYVRSAIGRNEEQKRTITALGLTKLNQSVVLTDSPSLRGMIARVQHLIEVEEV